MSDTNVHRVVGNLLVGTSHFFVDTTTNRVGVNTSSPSASLDIATGDLKVGSDITIGNSGTITATAFDGDGSLLQNINSDSGSWVNGTNSNVHLAVSTDKVGIGTEDPACALDIAGEDVMIRGNTPSLNFSEGTSGMGGGFRIHYDGANQVDDNNFLAIQHGTNFADTSLHCTLGGRVGIGTSSPDTKLHLHATGSGNVLDFKMSGSWSAGDYYRILGFNADKQIQFNYNDGMWLSDNNSIRFGCGGTQGASGLYTEQLRITSSGIYPTTIGRLDHNSGYLVGSYNNVGNNSYKVNPIYVIGSNYKPGSDDSMTGPTGAGNMYGIGYSHGNFNSILTSGWGLYVAANGSATIGLNADHGRIKCTGYVDTPILYASSQVNLGTSASIRQSSTSWTGDPGTQGKIEYHSNRWYIVAGSNSNELALFRRNGSDKCYISNEGNYGRKSHSSGHLVGSHNNVAANDTKTNPIYTIGSSYMPSDTSLGNMYGIGFSHGNFTAALRSNEGYGWGLYVAADGDARIGLNGSTGAIKMICEENGDSYAWEPANDGWLRLQGAAPGQGNMSYGYTSLAVGNFWSAGATRFSSDDRVKHFEEEIPNCLELINQLKPYKYKKTGKIYTEDYTGEIGEEGKDWDWEIGLIAQDVEKIPYFEHTVSKPEDGAEGKYGLNYTQFISVCIQGIKDVSKELQTMEAELKIAKADIETTKADIATLQAVNQKLEARLAFLESALIS